MTSLYYLVSRRKSRGPIKRTDPGSNSDGLMDILSNVVGVMALITSLTGIFAAGSSLNIQVPMQKNIKKDFSVIKVSGQGLWDLQPSIDAMVLIDRQRAKESNRCNLLLEPEKTICNRSLDSWQQTQKIASTIVKVTHANGFINIVGSPTIPSINIKNKNQQLLSFLERISKEDKALFILLENDGYANYRTIKRLASKYGIKSGWEPWYKGDPIYFWGNSGRSLSIQ